MGGEGGHEEESEEEMSDCRKGGRLAYLPPERPTLKRLAELNGEPPWELSVPDLYADVIPEESTELVGTLVWRDVRFVRDGDPIVDELLMDGGRIAAVTIGGVRYERAVGA